MTVELFDAKDRTPNAELVSLLESMLGGAKSGEMRSMIAVIAWDDSSVASGWVIDDRTPRRMMLAELAVSQHDFTTSILIQDGGNVLSTALTGE